MGEARKGEMGYTVKMVKKETLLENLSRESLLALIEHQARQIELFKAQVAQLTAQVEKLQGQLAKNSTNSSKPPSSDGLKNPAPKSRREKGQRKSGGQAGHDGNTLEMVAVPDEVVVHALNACPHCHTDLTRLAASRVVKRQVFDIPPIPLQVSEHQSQVKVCPCCGRASQAAFPAGVTAPTQYGPNVLAQAVYLNSYHLIPLARVREWFADCVGHALSEGTIERALAQLADAVAPSLDAIYAGLTCAPVVHYDETGFRINSALSWLHTACTEQLSYYSVHRKRGDEAMLDIGVLPNCRGWAVHDGLTGYFGFETARHALCNAHHLRELQFALEHHQASWAQALHDLLLEMKQRRQTPNLSADQLQALENRYDAILSTGLAAFPIQPRPPNSKNGSRSIRSPIC
jgi:transposase/uncharacterized coiled-coil protein SlyX